MNDATAPSDPAQGAPASVPPRPRRRWLRRIVATLVVLLVIVGLAPLAVRLPFVRSWVAERASRAVGADVTIAGASAWWTSGIDLEGVVLAGPPGYGGPLATVSKVHVDVALGRLLSGDVEATVEVTEPRLALRRRADGRWNLAEFQEQRAAKETAAPPEPPQAKDDGPGPALHLVVTDGVVEAHGLGGRVERFSKISLKADLAPDGAMEAALTALAEQAGVKGENVAIKFTGGTSPSGDTPLEVTFPEFDLARYAALTEGLTGWQGVRGTARVDAKGAVTAAGGVRGHLTLTARGIQAHTVGGVRVALGAVTAKADVAERPDASSAGVTLDLEQVEVVDGTGPDARTLVEPKVTVVLDALLQKDDSVRVAKFEVAAGQALRVKSVGPVTLSAPGADGRRLDGKAEVAADLARLSALKTFVPDLAPLRTGLLTATLEGRAAEGLDVGLGARVSNLALAPGDLAPEGYAERDVTLQGRFSRAKDGSMRVLVYAVKSALVQVSGAKPFEARFGTDGAASFSGPLDVTVDLDALSRALGGALGLAKGERLRGTLTARGTATGTPDDGRFETVLAGRGIEFPPSWGASRAPATLDGTVTFAWTPTALLGEVKDFRGLGLAIASRAAMKRDKTSTAFDGADATIGADLAQVRALFGTKMGIAPEATLAGVLKSTLRVSSTAAGRRVEGTTQTAGLTWRGKPDAALLEEPALTLEHALVLPRESGPVALEAARVRGNGWSADLSGSSFGTGETSTLDLTATIEGEAARLAERVRAFLGSEYQDLTGMGRVAGKVRFTSAGKPSLLAGGTASADLALGTWSSAGATLADGRLTLARAKTADPYQVALLGTLNTGTTSIGFGVTPAGEALGWRMVAALKGVDLSTVVVNHGAGKYLAFVLPTIVPADKSTPVLSGRLDTDVDLAASDLGGDAMMKSLAGKGTVALTQGTLGESTFFTAIGGGSGLGDVGKTLQTLAPAVGQELAGLQRSLSFQSLTSRFEIAKELIDVKEARLTGTSTRIDMTGVVHFDQRVDLATRLWIGSRGGEQLKKVIPDQTLPLRVIGTLGKPKMVPDVKVGDLLKGGLTQLPGNIGEGAADLGKKLEEEAKRLGRGLFGK